VEPQPIELEGTWEEIAAHAPYLAGRRVRLIVLPEGTEGPSTPEDTRSIEEKIAEIVAEVPEQEWAKLPSDLGDQLDHYIYGTPNVQESRVCQFALLVRDCQPSRPVASSCIAGQSKTGNGPAIQ
jgi:hypothetical protein